MTNLGDSFGWPFRDPSWLGKVIVQALILIIPIIGQIALLGWMLLNLDNIRAGRAELAPAGFHLERGIQLFGVQVLYGIVLGIPGWLLLVLGAAMGRSGGGAGLFALGQLYGAVVGLGLLFITPALVSATSRGGFSAGMDYQAVWRQATANVSNSVLTALIILVAGIIGEIGIILCFIGVFATVTYGIAVTAGAVAWFEQASVGGQAPTPTY